MNSTKQCRTSIATAYSQQSAFVVMAASLSGSGSFCGVRVESVFDDGVKRARILTSGT